MHRCCLLAPGKNTFPPFINARKTVLLANPFIASVNNEQTVKKLWIEKSDISLAPSNGNYASKPTKEHGMVDGDKILAYARTPISFNHG